MYSQQEATILAYLARKNLPTTAHEVSNELNIKNAKYSLNQLVKLGVLRKQATEINRYPGVRHTYFFGKHQSVHLNGITIIRTGGASFIQACPYNPPYGNCNCNTEGFGPNCRTWQEMRANAGKIIKEFTGNLAKELKLYYDGEINVYLTKKEFEDSRKA